MKHLFSSVSLIAAMAIVGGCSSPSKPKLELVKDQFDVTVRINPDEKSIYLIFTGHYSQDDDGHFENFDGAAHVLKTLAEHGVKGSFFPTGVCFRVDRYQQVMRDIIDQGHYLSGHSFIHILLCSYEDRNINLATFDSIANDNVLMEAELQKFGLKKEQYVWMVPPYEHYNQFSADAYRELGYKLANPTPGLDTASDWMGPEDPRYRSAQTLINNIWEFEREHTLNGAIILIHAMDYPSRTDEDRPYRHLGEVITRLKGLGYDFKSFHDVIAREGN